MIFENETGCKSISVVFQNHITSSFSFKDIFQNYMNLWFWCFLEKNSKTWQFSWKNQQFRVCPLTWFSNFLEHCLRVKPGSISYSTSEGSESVLWFLRMAIQWYTYTLLLPVGSKFQKEGTNMSFEFIKICWFQFFNFFRIRESPDTVLWNKSESMSRQS
jgi:hypothetical protein